MGVGAQTAKSTRPSHRVQSRLVSPSVVHQWTITSLTVSASQPLHLPSTTSSPLIPSPLLEIGLEWLCGGEAGDALLQLLVEAVGDSALALTVAAPAHSQHPLLSLQVWSTNAVVTMSIPYASRIPCRPLQLCSAPSSTSVLISSTTCTLPPLFPCHCPFPSLALTSSASLPTPQCQSPSRLAHRPHLSPRPFPHRRWSRGVCGQDRHRPPRPREDSLPRR